MATGHTAEIESLGSTDSWSAAVLLIERLDIEDVFAHAAESKAGLDVAVMPILHERRVAAIGFGGNGEAVPSPVEGLRSPVHAIGIAAMGLHFLDSLLLEELTRPEGQARR